MYYIIIYVKVTINLLWVEQYSVFHILPFFKFSQPLYECATTNYLLEEEIKY